MVLKKCPLLCDANVDYGPIMNSLYLKSVKFYSSKNDLLYRILPYTYDPLQEVTGPPCSDA